jgi:starch phosphorylase
MARIRRLAAWLERFDAAWYGVRVDQLRAEPPEATVGGELRIEALVELAGLRPTDVAVVALLGPLDDVGELARPTRELRLVPSGPARGGRARYRSEPLRLETGGTHGLIARLTPCHPDLLPSQALARAKWGP